MTKPIKDSKKPLQEPSWLSKYWFYTVLILLAVIGVPSAFFVPTLIPGLINDGNSIVSVRQGILAVLAGALTMLTLSETHRKNTYEKNKNERDHTRQVLAERRSRYAKAVEQLADEKASVRLGGIYTLAGLVDEWLADDALKLEEQQKEGQVIINNLCSYVRAPFPLAAKTEYLQSDVDIVPANYVGDFVADQVMFREEQDVRRTIFAEISNRSSTFTKDKNGNVFVTPGAWAEFDFDFSWAPIFYPLSNFTIEKAIFSSARFYGDANFIKTSFIQNVDFSRATFNGKAKFNGSEFAQEATFNEVVFNEVADFSDQGDVKTFFGGNVSFNYVRFAHGLADDALKLEEQQKEGQVIINNLCSYVRAPFPLAAKTEYLQSDVDIVPANYVGDFVADQVMFREEQDVRRTIFAEISNRSSTFTKDKNGNVFVTPGAWAEFDFDFSWAPIFYPLSNFTIEKAIFSSARFYGDANFIKTSFIQNVDFSRATFNGKAKFNGSEFAQEATFNEVVFNEVADFSDQGDVKTFFGGNVSFNYVRFAHDANFNGTTFAGNTNFSRAYFLGNAYFTNEAYVTKAAASFNTMEFSGVTFAGNASFRQATFASSANFREATFASSANFQEAAFKNEAVFMDTVFTCGVNFGRATFSSYANFNEATFKGGVRFAKTTFTNFEPSFAVMCWRARFSALINPQDYCFAVTEESKPIRCGTATLLGKPFTIPLGTVLFDPSSRDKNTRTSEPAKPLDNSNRSKDDTPE